MRLDVFNSILLIMMCFGGANEPSFWRAIMVYLVMGVIWMAIRIIVKADKDRKESQII